MQLWLLSATTRGSTQCKQYALCRQTIFSFGSVQRGSVEIGDLTLEDYGLHPFATVLRVCDMKGTGFPALSVGAGPL